MADNDNARAVDIGASAELCQSGGFLQLFTLEELELHAIPGFQPTTRALCVGHLIAVGHALPARQTDALSIQPEEDVAVARNTGADSSWRRGQDWIAGAVAAVIEEDRGKGPGPEGRHSCARSVSDPLRISITSGETAASPRSAGSAVAPITSAGIKGRPAAFIVPLATERSHGTTRIHPRITWKNTERFATDNRERIATEGHGRTRVCERTRVQRARDRCSPVFFRG